MVWGTLDEPSSPQRTSTIPQETPAGSPLVSLEAALLIIADVTKRIDVALLPAEAIVSDADCYLVIDLLRATTTIAMLFTAGLRDLVVVDSLGLAQEYAALDNRLLLGEIGGLPPEGFDYGNSPVEAAAAPVHGRGAVLFTSNGTPALCARAGHGTVLACSLVNAPAVVADAARYETVLVTCAGTSGGTRLALEDFLAAGAVVRMLMEKDPKAEVGDAARLAADTAASGQLREQVFASQHGQETVQLGFSPDIELALTVGASETVPEVVEHGTGWARLVDRNAEGPPRS